MVVPCCNPIEVKFKVGQVGENVLTMYAKNAKFDEDRPTVDYTRCPYISETPPYILNVLEYKYYTSTKPITIFFKILVSDKNVSPISRKRVKGDNFNVFKSNLYILTYHLNTLLQEQ